MYRICKKTIMDNSDPSIKFDDQGFSNHYWEFEKFIKPRWFPNKKGSDIFRKKIEQIKKDKTGDFDCILGLSGGVDSSYMLHLMVNEYKLNPLVFHVDAGWNSETAVHNINVLVEKLNIDLFTEVINWNEVRDFQLSLFKSGVPHLDIPQDMAFISTLYRYAEKNNIKYILNGGNISTECVLPPLEILYWPTDLFQVNDILKKYSTVEMNNYPFISIFYHKLYLRYFKKIKVLKPLNFTTYLKNDAINTLVNEYNWKPYKQKHFESRFTKFFEGYWLPSRFGYDMRRNQLSSLILTEQISRDEALQEIEKPPYDPETIKSDIEFIANKLEISQSELMSYHEMPRKYYWDYKNIKKIFDIGEYILKLISGTRRGGAL